MDLNKLKHRILMKVETNLSQFYDVGKNIHSPAGKGDKREWYMCKLCDYSTLTPHGISIHLTKRHKIVKKKSNECIVDVAIEECLKEMEKI